MQDWRFIFAGGLFFWWRHLIVFVEAGDDDEGVFPNKPSHRSATARGFAFSLAVCVRRINSRDILLISPLLNVCDIIDESMSALISLKRPASKASADD